MGIREERGEGNPPTCLLGRRKREEESGRNENYKVNNHCPCLASSIYFVLASSPWMMPHFFVKGDNFEYSFRC